MDLLPTLRFIVCYASLLLSSLQLDKADPQTSTIAITDPSEARAVDSIFQRLGVSPPTGWNISGELCTGVAIGTTQLQDINPGIKCDCSYNDGSLCHITGLRIYSMDVVGPLPEELWNLTFLTDLNLAQNYFTGPLSSSIGNLIAMQYLSLGINAFSGLLPKELGLLTDLRVLAIGTNNFSGSFPSEIGNLTRLTQIYFDSSGISGVIPQSFSHLRSLATVWASDNQLSGQIPDFIGNWSMLTTLRFQGNSFQGPIPTSFSQLTSLTDLRISDLSNGNSSLNFLRDMKSLSTLVLRNNNLSGFIPSVIGSLQSLLLLDLSFNNLEGRIPDSLFSLSSLTHLFLGSNKLTGLLPLHKNTSLHNIDLSYNELSGELPSWINTPNLQLNLVANNFTLSTSNSSGLSSGLNCLQKSFPCGQVSPIYYNFSIKCGGPQITSADRTVYESDNETLGPATYFLTSTRRWAVSNAGLPADVSNPIYVSTSSSQFTNTLDSELFQTARISAGSLRYYGLGLENGIYTVKLMFAESQILNPITWKSLGRRVFHIFIQSNLVWKDFDIQKAAGKKSLTAFEHEFKALVSENYLEIHLFWAGKGTCCVPYQGAYGPSISAISATPDFIPKVSNISPDSKKNKTGLVVGIAVAVAFVSLISAVAIIYIFIRRKKKNLYYEDEEFLGIDARPYTFSYAELRGATDDFDPANKLGEGGFGPVFKGRLNDGRDIAVKQLSVASRHGKSQFVAEIATISAVQHRNLVKLYGCCIAGEKRLLVYEYLVNKSLDQALFGNKSDLRLDWPTRFEICIGVAKGLAYLHEESRVRIVHRDVKSSNILLDSFLTPKISDFGLAKLYDDNKTHISTRVAGTIGYLAPEYALRGHLTEKADVFGFGVVALEIVSGRPNSELGLEEDQMYLLEWAWHLHEKECEKEVVDSKLTEFDEKEVSKVIGVGLLCTQASPTQRPSMTRVVAMLTGDIEVAKVATKPGYLTDWKYTEESSLMMSKSRFDSPYDPSPSMVADNTNTRSDYSFSSIIRELVAEG